MTRLAAVAVPVVALTLALCPGAWAGGPTEALRDVFTEVNGVLGDSELQKTPSRLRGRIRDILIHAFDARETARLALGDEWQARTPEEREEFASLLADHLERTYVFHLAARIPLRRPLAIRYLDESVSGRSVTVATALEIPDGGPLLVDYRLLQLATRWVIFDIVVDGTSLVASYRTLFSSLLGEGSYPGLLAWMRARATRAPLPREPSAGPPNPTAQRPLETGSASARNAKGTASLTASEPAPTRSVAAAGTAYWLQVGAFKDSEAAGVLAARLLAQNFPISIDASPAPAPGQGPGLSRVRVGPFGDQAEAVATLRDLEKNGYRPFLAVERR